MTFAKGITSGYVPLGGVVVGERIQEPFWGSAAAGVWRHGYTYSGHATAAAAAHVNLDIIEREGLVARGLELEAEIAAVLAPLTGHELVSELRAGFGAVAAVQVDPALLANDPGLTDRITLRARDHGVLTRTLVGGGLQISPPLVITRAELEEVASGLAGALDDIAAAR
jgi:putrescine---pyruvate transaminase